MIYSVASIRSFAESYFDVDAYIADPEGYFELTIRPAMEGFVYNTIARSDIISSAYLALDPNLAGRPLVNEIYMDETDQGIEVAEPQTYEEYMDIHAEDMAWFYGAFNSGLPYWTRVYWWGDTEQLVSYVEPVIVDGRVIGVAGADMSMEAIKTLIQEKQFYETGFAILIDNFGEFIETSDFVSALSANEREVISSAANSAEDGFTTISIGGTRYVLAVAELVNGYQLLAIVPWSEFRSAVNESLISFVIIFVIAFAMVIVIGYFIGKNFGKPLVTLIKYLKKAALTGEITPDQEDKAAIEKYSQQRDEIGQSIVTVSQFLDRIDEVSKELEAVANGDLTIEITTLSDKDLLGNSLHHMNVKLNEMFKEIGLSSEQVSSGAKQIADGSQVLAQGATEQAASVEELSSSIAEIAQKTKENADIAEKAASLAGNIMSSAEKGNVQMTEMQNAVKEINEASQSIGKIIKTIDDIAFQTNILALNAAVEAARAGQHGKGFAVVAEEVRNLAAKSANAAKETGTMIQNSMDKASLGVRIADETHANFAEIATGINESGQLISLISESLDDQSSGISQINVGIDQVAQVTQQSSATAQESAAASAEMSDQSASLQGLVAQFKLKEDSNTVRRLGAFASGEVHETSEETGGDLFGKY